MATPKSKIKFPTSTDSPFEDGYDIAGERDALKDLVEAEEPDEKDPRWERFMDLLEREERLRQEQANRQQRQYADPIVADAARAGRHANRVDPVVSRCDFLVGFMEVDLATEDERTSDYRYFWPS